MANISYADELRKLSNDAVEKQALQRDHEIAQQVQGVMTFARQQAAKGDYYIEFTTELYPEAMQILNDNGLTVTLLDDNGLTPARVPDWRISW